MRNFFNSHWKVILAILLAIVLAVLTIESGSSASTLAARLQTHAQALAPGSPHSQPGAKRHLEASLAGYGYAPRLRQASGAAHPGHSIEASLANLAPGVQPSRIFIVGAHLGSDGGVSAAAVLELAHAIKNLRPALGTEIRFVFFMDDENAAGNKQVADPGQSGAGNFMAFVGTRASSHRVRQALAALRVDPMLGRHGLAAPAHVMGLTLFGHGQGDDEGPALVITDTGFLRFPYFHAQTLHGRAQTQEEAQAQAHARAHERNDYDSMARIVSGLARTLGALAGSVQT
jgi:hypothetical protein